MLETAEAIPFSWADLNRRAQEFDNTTTTTSKKENTTTKKTTTTTKKTTTKASSEKPTSTKASSAKPTSAKAITDASSAVPSSTPTSVTPMLIPAATNTAMTSATVSSPAATALADTNSGGVSGGAIGGIVAAIVIIILGAVAYFFVRRKKNNKSRARHLSTKPDPFTMGYGSDQAFHTPQPMQQQQPAYQHQYGVQPTVAVTSPTTPTHYNSNTQFQDANNHIIAESMKPAAVVPQSQQYQPQPQEYKPQLNEQYNNEHLDPVVPISAATAAVAAVPVSGALLSPTQAGSVGVFHVAATYTPTLSDEIDIQTGDQVEVLVEYDDGWCQGINLSRGNAKGVFPKHCIDYASGVSSSGNSIDRVKRVSSMYIA
ncbi:hypothetical protein INT47_000937 [Mucor saturninus]|uniref:SH3 domain-containing protein n=1 Tax=Mucor saturninus TaxID=64648 RepID=A0A8H7RR83_9FUNG|nr:hypothetical protein INT47_000937 [Mucor saturninus]